MGYWKAFRAGTMGQLPRTIAVRTGLLLTLLPLHAVAAPDEAVTQLFNDPTPVSLALAQGDVATLRRLQKKHGSAVVGLMARAAERRVLNDLPGTLAASAACEREAAKTHHAAGLTVCGLLAAGAEAAQGDLPAWARRTMETRTAVHAGSAARGKTLGRVDVFAGVPDYAPLAARPVPKVQVVGTGRIPLHAGTVAVAASTWHPGGEVAYPNMVKLQVDGRETEALVDTGSSLTLLMPDAVPATPFMDWVPLHGIFGTSDVRSRLAQPDTLQMGSLVLRQPLISISDRTPVNLLGMDVLSRLGRVILSADSLEVLAPGQVGPACAAPLFTGTDVTGLQMGPRMFIELDGKRQEVMLDTGNNVELRRALPKLAPLPPGPQKQSVIQGVQGQQSSTSVASQAQVKVGERTASLEMHTSIGAHPSKERYVLGGGALHKVAVYLDFVGNRACLVPRPPAPPGL